MFCDTMRSRDVKLESSCQHHREFLPRKIVDELGITARERGTALADRRCLVTRHSSSSLPLVSDSGDLSQTCTLLVRVLKDADQMTALRTAAERWLLVSRGSRNADELVGDVIDDFYRGVRQVAKSTCDPNAEAAGPDASLKRLTAALMDRIKDRALHERRRARRDKSIRRLKDDETFAVEEPKHRVFAPDATLLGELLDRARPRLDGDTDALQLLELYKVSRVFRKRDVLRLGMSHIAYAGARSRLMSVLRAEARALRDEHDAEPTVGPVAEPEAGQQAEHGASDWADTTALPGTQTLAQCLGTPPARRGDAAGDHGAECPSLAADRTR